MKITSIITYCLCLINSIAMAQNNRTDMGNYSKSYSGNESTQVTITRYGSATNNEILIYLEGIDHSWDKKIFKAKANTGNGATRDYSIKYEGKTYTILNWKNGVYTLYLPQENIMEEVQQSLKYSNLSVDFSPERLLTAYNEQEIK